MTDDQRSAILDQVKANIHAHGYHVRVVNGGPTPRFIYTIGLFETLGLELVLAGGAFYSIDEAKAVIAAFVAALREGAKADDSPEIDTTDHGSFTLQPVDPSWANMLLLGAFDYFQQSEIPCYQITPDEAHETIDTPELQEPWSGNAEPAWRWLAEEWNHPVSPQSKAITNLDALLGKDINEVVRWEEDEWEMFSGSGPDTPQEEMRLVALGTMLAFDPTLSPILQLPVGEGLWREDADSEWQEWKQGEYTDQSPSP